MAVCRALKRDGERCMVGVGPGEAWCWNHDPAHAEERKRNASRAGRSKPSKEIANLKSLLAELTDRVIGRAGSKSLPTKAAAVANQLINTRLRAIEQERKNRETEDLEARLEQLERRHAQRERASPRGDPRPWSR